MFPIDSTTASSNRRKFLLFSFSARGCCGRFSIFFVRDTPGKILRRSVPLRARSNQVRSFRLPNFFRLPLGGATIDFKFFCRKRFYSCFPIDSTTACFSVSARWRCGLFRNFFCPGHSLRNSESIGTTPSSIGWELLDSIPDGGQTHRHTNTQTFDRFISR